MRHNTRRRVGEYISTRPDRRRLMDVFKEDMKLIGARAEDAEDRVTVIVG